MSVLHPKSKTISFRLSQREFATAEAIAREQSFESLSDFARHAVLTFGYKEVASNESNELRQMKQRMNLLMQEISNLSRKVGEE